MLVPTAVAALALLATTSAHPGCGGGEVMRRNPGGRLIEKRQSAPTDEPSAASSTDGTFECTAYSYAPVLALKSSYPAIWQTADIVANDTEATALFTTINATVNSRLPTDTPHCFNANCNAGNFTGSTYNATDPDCWWTWHQCTTPANATGLPADITTVPEPNTWGYGFDDGPNCSHNAFYDFLLENNQKATMFYIGSNIMDWPLQAMRGLTDGHQICVHTWSHKYMTTFSNQQAFAELYYTRKLIKDVLGVTPLCWRPPYGDVDNRIRLIAQGLNLTTIVWSDDSEDWKEGVPADNVTAADVTANYQSVISKAANGTYATHGPVVLTHELTNFTMSEAITEYTNIKAAFKYVVPLCTAMNQTHPYAESNITCPDFASYIGGETNVSTSATNAVTSSSASSTSTGTSVSSSSSGGSTQGASKSGTASTSGARSETSLGLGWIGLTLLALVGSGVAML